MQVNTVGLVMIGHLTGMFSGGSIRSWQLTHDLTSFTSGLGTIDRDLTHVMIVLVSVIL